MSDPLCERLRRATRTCLHKARPLLAGHGRRLPEVTVRCDLRGRAAGQVRQGTDGRLEIRYNLEIARLQPDAFVARTVAHEVAHLIVWRLHGRQVRPHGAEWQAVMRALGASPERCHDFAVPQHTLRQQRRWRYRCACREHQLSTTRHNRVQNGQQRYLCRDCGEVLQPAP